MKIIKGGKVDRKEPGPFDLFASAKTWEEAVNQTEPITWQKLRYNLNKAFGFRHLEIAAKVSQSYKATKYSVGIPVPYPEENS